MNICLIIIASITLYSTNSRFQKRFFVLLPCHRMILPVNNFLDQFLHFSFCLCDIRFESSSQSATIFTLSFNIVIHPHHTWFTTLNTPRLTSLIIRTIFRPITMCLVSPLFIMRIPLVNRDFSGHYDAPWALFTFLLVCERVKSDMSVFSVNG